MIRSRYLAILAVLAVAVAGGPAVAGAGQNTELDHNALPDRHASGHATSHDHLVAGESTDHAHGHDHDDEGGHPHLHDHSEASPERAAEIAGAITANRALYEGVLAQADPNPIAYDEPTYQVYGRVFSDPHGCLVHGDVAPPEGAPVSPYAKGRACAPDYLTYEEVIEGTKFLERRFPDLVQIQRLDQYPGVTDGRSAGIARPAGFNDDGALEVFTRDRSPLYLFKVTNRNSPIAEEDRLHFAHSLSIHGLERAGLEGGIRAMEDLVTWAACEMEDARADSTPACAEEGPFPKRIVESETERPVPTAGDVLDNTVNYFFLPNPDGWRIGQKRSPTELRGGNVNANYLPGPSYLRGNGHGVDLNRDWPSVGYTLKSHQPLSEPESRAYHDVFSQIRDRTSDGRFAAGIDLHGMFDASAFSYTLLGADERDYRKNAITVETSLRTYEDQTERLRWSPYIGDSTGDGQQDRTAVIPVADEWGTIYDTIGYTVTGALGFWMDDSRIGLGGVGINNEMALSNLAPNTVYEPALNQTHIDGNKGLIYSQIAALMFEEEVAFTPTGKVGYVHNPVRITEDGWERPQNPGNLGADNDINVLLPCQGALLGGAPTSCGDGEFYTQGSTAYYEFTVGGPPSKWNGGMTVRSTTPQQGVGAVHLTAGVVLQHFDEESDSWVTKKTLSRTNTTYNDPEPGRWRVSFGATASMPRRLEITFSRDTAEEHPGQLPIDASSMDFFTALNEYIPAGSELEAVEIASLTGGDDLTAFDTLIVVNNLGRADWLRDELGMSDGEIEAYFEALRAFAQGGGNLVLTDGALHSLESLDLVPNGSVIQQGGLAGFYAFRTSSGTVTYEDPESYPLTRGVDLPGAAERTLGNRQAVEPTPLGFSPSGASHARMPFWGVQRTVWESLCEKDSPTLCTTAATSAQGSLASLGEIALGDGVVRIVGSLLPDPLRQEDGTADNRFGLASYAITYTAYIVFENLIDWQRPATDPVDPDPVATALVYTGDESVRGNTVELAAMLLTVGGDPVEDRELVFDFGGEEYTATTGEDGEARVTARMPGGGQQQTVTVVFAGDDDYEPAETSAVIRRGNAGGGGGTSESTIVAGWQPLAATGAGGLIVLMMFLASAVAVRRR